MKRNPINSVAFILDGVKEELDEEQLAKLNKWLAEIAGKIDDKHARMGLEHLVAMAKREGRVYTGAGGGNLTFSVTPTGLGTVFRATDSITSEKIDLTDYEKLI